MSTTSSPSKDVRRLFAVAAVGCAALSAARTADALITPSGTSITIAEPPPEQDKPLSADTDTHLFRVGAIAGIGFPRPLGVEAMVKVGGYVALGVEYSVLPTFDIAGIDTKLWSVAGDLRVFPLRNAFFVGVTGGYQFLRAAGALGAAGFNLPAESAELDSWYLTPKIGFLWTIKYGLTVGIDGGVQLPLAAAFQTTLPTEGPVAHATQNVVRTLSGPLPAVDLLRIGLLF